MKKLEKFFAVQGVGRTMFLSVVLYALAMPPVNFWPLIWFVPILWGRMIERDSLDIVHNGTAKKQRRFFRSPYWKIYACSLAFWLTMTFWVCFPHSLTSLGWLALSTYLACYLPLFVGVSRIIVHRWNCPVFIVAPLVWVSVELLRNHVFGGMSLAALEHAFYRIPLLIQTADLGGEYLIGFIIVLVGCALGTGRSRSDWFFGVGVSVCVLTAMILYGYWHLQKPQQKSQQISQQRSQLEPFRIAVTQGNYPVMLDPPADWWEKTFQQYIDLTDETVRQANAENKPLDLIVWPETVFPYPFLAFDDDFVPEQYHDSDLTPQQMRKLLNYSQQKNHENAHELVARWNTPTLYGATTLRFRKGQNEEDRDRLNSAVLVCPTASNEIPDAETSENLPRYDKVHLVMFGEYVPLAEYLPDDFPLKTLCQTASRGTGPVAIPVPQRNSATPFYLSANICFEGLVPHLIRRQVYDLRRSGKEPDLLVNLSNVGWFYFTSEIDLQFAAQIFRAVENRKPYITAANGGFSAWIDADGRIRQQGRRREAVAFVAEIVPETRKSLYTVYGDWFAHTCMVLTIVACLVSLISKRSSNVGTTA